MSNNWKSSLILEEGEELITHWKGDYEIRERVVTASGVTDVKKNILGILVLTNRRLIFLEEHGLIKKSYHQVLTIPLEKIESISLGGILIPFVSISDGVKTHIFHLVGVGKEKFGSFRQLIIEQRRKRKEEIEAEKKRERIYVMIDFSFIKDYLERGGLILQTFKCPSCGAPLKFPESGKIITCPYCNNEIRAEDVFEKIKSLI